MRKIAVISFKGGTGKTTTVVNIGAGLAMRGKRVLLVDVDAQGGLAVSLGSPFSRSIADLLTGTAVAQECVVHARPNLDVLASDNALLPAQRALARYVNCQGVLAAALQPIEPAYNFVLLDCAASLTLPNINALTYATEIFIPTQVDYLSLVDFNRTLENLARVRFPKQPRQAIPDLGISLIIPTMYDARNRQSLRLLADLRQAYGRHVADPVRVDVRLAEAPAHRETIFEYAPDSPGASDYSHLVDQVLDDTLLAGEEPVDLQRPFHPSRHEGPPSAEEPAAAEGPHLAPTPPAEPSLSLQCPYCDIPLVALQVAGYRVYHCERCGYQKQVLTRDLRVR